MSGALVFAAIVLTLGGLYAIFAMILNLEAGWGGMWDLGVAGLLAVGAYTYVIFTLPPGTEPVEFAFGWPIWAGVLMAALVTGVVAFIIGTPALRLRGEFFLITTFAFAEVIRQVILNQTSVTKGTVGFSKLDRPFESYVEGRNYNYLLLGMVVFVVLVMYLFTRRLGRAPYGRLLRSYRDNEPLALSLGKHVTRYRIQTFVLAGVLFGAVAPMYVWTIRFVTPSLFTSDITFTVWIALVVGGLASVGGPVVGAIVLIGVTEGLRFIPVSVEHAVLLSSTRPMLLGLALILVLRFRPEGLIPERRAFRNASKRFEAAIGRGLTSSPPPGGAPVGARGRPN